MTELLIGRESKDNRLQLTIGAKVGVYGTVGSVPQSISRKHCIISFNDEKDSMKLSICKDNNLVYVNGVPVVVCALKMSDIVELGYQRYKLDMDIVADFVKKNKATLPQTVDIRGLEAVWNQYKKQITYYQTREKITNLVGRISPILTLGGGAIGAVLGITKQGNNQINIIIVIAVIISIIIFIISFFDAFYITRKREKLNIKMIDDYSCPNCHFYFGNQPYDVIKSNLEVCPKCKAKLTK